VAKLREGGLAALRELRDADNEESRAQATAEENLKVLSTIRMSHTVANMLPGRGCKRQLTRSRTCAVSAAGPGRVRAPSGQAAA
jgi:hypothetical protein